MRGLDGSCLFNQHTRVIAFVMKTHKCASPLPSSNNGIIRRFDLRREQRLIQRGLLVNVLRVRIRVRFQCGNVGDYRR